MQLSKASFKSPNINYSRQHGSFSAVTPMQPIFASRLLLFRTCSFVSQWIFDFQRSISTHSFARMSTENQPASSPRAPYSITLEDLTPTTWSGRRLADIAYGMKRSGFHRWGFVIYRTTYDDDKAWDRYLEVLQLTRLRTLLHAGADLLLEQYMDCKRTSPLIFRT